MLAANLMTLFKIERDFLIRQILNKVLEDLLDAKHTSGILLPLS